VSTLSQFQPFYYFVTNSERWNVGQVLGSGTTTSFSISDSMVAKGLSD